MSIFIQLPSNRTITLDSSNLKTVLDIKTKIYENEGYPISIQTLTFESAILKNDDALPDRPDPTFTLSFPIRGGGKHGNNHRNRQNTQVSKRELVLAAPEESDYGQVLKLLGDKRAEVMCLSSGKLLMCRIAGRIHQWIQREDIVLIGLRNFEPGKGDIILRYTPVEARKLMKSGYIPSSIKINAQDNKFDSNEASVEFIDDTPAGGNDDESTFAQNKTYDMPPSSSDSEDIDNI